LTCDSDLNPQTDNTDTLIAIYFAPIPGRDVLITKYALSTDDTDDQFISLSHVASRTCKPIQPSEAFTLALFSWASGLDYVPVCFAGISQQESLALASMARDDPPASSTASSTARATSSTAAL